MPSHEYLPELPTPQLLPQCEVPYFYCPFRLLSLGFVMMGRSSGHSFTVAGLRLEDLSEDIVIGGVAVGFVLGLELERLSIVD